MALPPSVGPTVHTSVLLRKLIDEATDDHFTLDWMFGNLPKHSFGVIMLFLALISILPVISIVSRLLLILLALQIVFGYRSPVLPRRLMVRPLPSRYVARLDRHALPALKRLEKVVRPRWPVLLRGTQRFTAFVAIILMVFSLLAPLPLANVPPAAICVLMALAYIEHDGLMLVTALFLAITTLVAVGVAIF